MNNRTITDISIPHSDINIQNNNQEHTREDNQHDNTRKSILKQSKILENKETNTKSQEETNGYRVNRLSNVNIGKKGTRNNNDGGLKYAMEQMNRDLDNETTTIRMIWEGEAEPTNTNILNILAHINGKTEHDEITSTAIVSIDGGSAITLINRSYAEQNQIPRYDDQPLETQGIHGSRETHEEYVDIEVTMVGVTNKGNEKKKTSIPIRAWISNSMDENILMGLDVLTRYPIRQDFRNNCLHIEIESDDNLTIQGIGEEMKKTLERDTKLRKMRSTKLRGLHNGRNATAEQRAKREQREIMERNNLEEYKSKCTNRPDQNDIKPELFPMELWPLVRDDIKPLVKDRWNRYTDARLKAILPIISTIDISQEDELRKEEEPYIRADITSNLDVFFNEDENLTKPVKGFEFKIEVTDHSRLSPKYRTKGFTIEEKAFLQAKTGIMIQQNRLEMRAGEHVSSVVLVPYPERINKFKETHGELANTEMFKTNNRPEVSQWFRLTVDYRELNKRIKMSKWTLPLINDLLNKVTNNTSRWTASDIADAFHTIALPDRDSQELTGFLTHEGRYVYLCMPQGIATAAEIWAMIVSKVFKDLEHTNTIIYQDDVFNFHNDFIGHMDTNHKIYEEMRKHNMIFKPSKYHCNYRMMKILGHIMTEEGRCANPELTRAIHDIGIPTDQSQVRSIVGLALVAKEYCRNMATEIEPLQELMKKNVDVVNCWKDEIHGKALEKIKTTLTSSPILKTIDTRKEFRIHVDACRRGRGLGAVLLQPLEEEPTKGNETWTPVAYWSLKLTETEREYSATDLECKAMHDAILHWGIYLRTGREFTVITDHYALVFLATKSPRDSNGRIMRYVMDLIEYRFNVIHRKGKEHLDADAVSRLLRYGDNEIRLLTRDDLEEDGVVTKTDEEDLREYHGILLPREGINIPTKEDMLNEKEQWENTENSRLQTKDLMDTIELKHMTERLENSEIDIEDFTERYMKTEEETEEAIKEIKRQDLKVLSNKVIYKKVTFDNDGTYNKEYNPEESTHFIVETETKRVNYREPFIKDRRQTRKTNNKEREEEYLKYMEFSKKRGEMDRYATKQDNRNIDKDLKHRSQIKDLRIDEIHWNLLKPNDDFKLKEVVPDTIEEQLLRSEHNCGNRKTRKQLEIEEELDKLRYVVGKRYTDEEDGNTYRIVSIEFDKQIKRPVIRRTIEPSDYSNKTKHFKEREAIGKDEGTDRTFILDNGTHDSIINRIKLFQANEKEELEILSEEMILKLQIEDEALKEITRPILCGKPNGEGNTVITIPWGNNKKKNTFTWDGEGAIKKSSGEGGPHRIIVPETMKRLLMKRYHDYHAHTGTTRTRQNLAETYYWKDMGEDIEEYVQTCEQCQRSKSNNTRRAPIQTYPPVKKPWERCHIDLTGPFIKTKRGNRYILIFTDFLTKWVEVFAVRNKTAIEVAECLFDEIIMRHGAPITLHSDRGTEFVNEVVDQTTILMRIKRVTTSPYHPQANGHAERIVKSIKDGLRSYVNIFQDDWDEYLAIVAFYYRNTKHSATGYTPYELLYGRKCTKPDEIWIKEFNHKMRDGITTVNEYVKGLSESLETTWELLSDKQNKETAKITNKRNQNIRKFRTYGIGDLILLATPPKLHLWDAETNEQKKLTHNFQDEYMGPYKVIAKINPVTYAIRAVNNEKGRISHAHTSRMRPYNIRKREVEEEENKDGSEEEENISSEGDKDP
jgi:transposase InsO family protein